MNWPISKLKDYWIEGFSNQILVKMYVKKKELLHVKWIFAFVVTY